MASIHIGTIFTGKVDSINQESIQTKFFMLGLPLIPLESFYCLRMTPKGIQGFPIKLNLKSVLMAYLRWWGGIASFMLLLFGFVSEDYYLLPLGFLVGAIAVSTIWLGRLSKKEKNRRQVLVNIVGMGIPPNLLPPDTVSKINANLENAWGKSTYSSYQENWRNISSIKSVPINMLPLLFCLAMYNKKDQTAEEVWQVIESDALINNDSSI